MQYTKITKDLFDNLATSRERQEFKKLLSELSVNQGVTLDIKEWKIKTHPRSETSNYSLSTKYAKKFATKQVGDTFAILRTA